MPVFAKLLRNPEFFAVKNVETLKQIVVTIFTVIGHREICALDVMICNTH